MNKFWRYGTHLPIQRIGLIVLSIGIISFISWCIDTKTVFWIDSFSGWDPYRYPEKYDPFFYKIHPVFIPIGIVLTWLYIPVNKIMKLIKGWIFQNN